MRFVDNDRWAGSFPLTRNTRYLYTVEAWRDQYESWRVEVTKKHDANVPIALELTEGRRLIEAAAEAAQGDDARALAELLARLEARQDDQGWLLAVMLGEEVRALMERAGVRANLSRYGRELEVVVDRTAAQFAAWYEIFPRSMSDDPNRHGTFDDVIRHLPYARDMGFDVALLSAHPPDRPQQPQGPQQQPRRRSRAIPAAPTPSARPRAATRRSTPSSARSTISAASSPPRTTTGSRSRSTSPSRRSPDHPWITQHPECFDWRPDGTLKYAENPPKKYEDIVTLEFYNGALPSVWYELRDIVLFWVVAGREDLPRRQSAHQAATRSGSG